jgi:hypothetical protein
VQYSNEWRDGQDGDNEEHGNDHHRYADAAAVGMAEEEASYRRVGLENMSRLFLNDLLRGEGIPFPNGGLISWQGVDQRVMEELYAEVAA